MVVYSQRAKRRRPPLARLGAMCAMGAMLIVASLTSYTAATAGVADELYRARTVVTGQGEANRLIGFASCLQEVLIKVSGAQKLAKDRRLAPYKSDAKEYVAAFTYHDQMSGKPKRDEQGTRDRPYDLIVDFNQTKIDGILRTLGLKPWISQRPVLAVFIEMQQGARRYMITADAEETAIQREALLTGAARRGMKIVLPSQAALARLDRAKLQTMPSSSLTPMSGQGGDVVLIGRLVWDDQELEWITEWRMDWQGQPHEWPLNAVTFDEVFRQAIGGAAQILSGNGDPA